MELNNFELVKSLLSFSSPNEFYFLQIIQRKKDFREDHGPRHPLGTNNNNRLIKAYYIYSLEELQKKEGEIIALCKLFKARAGINLNKRDIKVVSLEMMELLARNIRVNTLAGLPQIFNSVCGQTKGTDKVWIVDIDHKLEESVFMDIRHYLHYLEPIGNKCKAYIPTLAGGHLITSVFNTQKFVDAFPEYQVHKNNPTLLYYNDKKEN